MSKKRKIVAVEFHGTVADPLGKRSAGVRRLVQSPTETFDARYCAQGVEFHLGLDKDKVDRKRRRVIAWSSIDYVEDIEEDSDG